MKSPIEQMINASVKCCNCGKQGYMTCDCWTKCPEHKITHLKDGTCRLCDFSASEGK